MPEKIIDTSDLNLLELYGVNDRYLNLIRQSFPKVKIIARGDELKVVGDEKNVDDFVAKFSALVFHYEKFGKITESDILQVLENGADFYEEESDKNVLDAMNHIIVHGNYGKIIRALTPNQIKMVESIEKHDMIFAIGPAGTGKTYTAVAMAVKALKNKKIKRIILTRPAVEAGENLGFLPGDLREKLDPYMQPLYDALKDMIPTQKLLTYVEDGTIEIAPLAFMRGRTLDYAYVILDEAQNATTQQMKMFVTRMGKSSKFIVTGDKTQVDLPGRQQSGLRQAEELLKKIQGIDFIYLDDRDVVRHHLVTKIIEAYNKSNDYGSISKNSL